MHGIGHALRHAGEYKRNWHSLGPVAIRTYLSGVIRHEGVDQQLSTPPSLSLGMCAVHSPAVSHRDVVERYMPLLVTYMPDLAKAVRGEESEGVGERREETPEEERVGGGEEGAEVDGGERNEEAGDAGEAGTDGEGTEAGRGEERREEERREEAQEETREEERAEPEGAGEERNEEAGEAGEAGREGETAHRASPEEGNETGGDENGNGIL